MKNRPSFELTPDDIHLSDPEALADRLAGFLRSSLRPDDLDRDLVVMFVDRLFLALCDDFDEEELLRGAEVKFCALTREKIDSIKGLRIAVSQGTTKARVVKAGS